MASDAVQGDGESVESWPVRSERASRRLSRIDEQHRELERLAGFIVGEFIQNGRLMLADALDLKAQFGSEQAFDALSGAGVMFGLDDAARSRLLSEFVDLVSSPRLNQYSSTPDPVQAPSSDDIATTLSVYDAASLDSTQLAQLIVGEYLSMRRVPIAYARTLFSLAGEEQGRLLIRRSAEEQGLDPDVTRELLLALSEIDGQGQDLGSLNHDYVDIDRAILEEESSYSLNRVSGTPRYRERRATVSAYELVGVRGDYEPLLDAVRVFLERDDIPSDVVADVEWRRNRLHDELFLSPSPDPGVITREAALLAARVISSDDIASVEDAFEDGIDGPLGSRLADDMREIAEIASETANVADDSDAAVRLGNRAAAALEKFDHDLADAGAPAVIDPAHPDRVASPGVRARKVLSQTEVQIVRWGTLVLTITGIVGLLTAFLKFLF